MRVAGKFIVVLGVVVGVSARHAVAEDANLLSNGGFEKDGDGNGIADGWVAQPFNFSREKLKVFKGFVDDLPPYKELLKGQRILAADGTVLSKRDPDGSWKSMLGRGGIYWGDFERSWKYEQNWYERLRREVLPQNSRFGELPVPNALSLGNTTLVLSSNRPHKQVMSAPTAVKRNTGYRLSFWVRLSGGSEYVWLAQVLDATAGDPESVSPVGKDYYYQPAMLNAMPATYWWGGAKRYWTRLEIPFRTGPSCDRIIIRLPYNHRDEADRMKMRNENHRIWYDDLRLVEDGSVRMGDEGYPAQPKPQWPKKALERGFVTAPRPTLPITYSSYLPSADEIDAPIRLALAAGETDSAVIFVRNLLNENIVVQASGASDFQSEKGYGLQAAYGARFVTLRAAEMATRFLTAKRFVYTPKFLINSSTLSVGAGSGGQFWMTVSIPPGTPAGEYTGELKVARVKPASGDLSTREVSIPVVLTVRDLYLEESDAAFFTWYHTSPVEGTMGPTFALPGADEIYLADQRRHGMNTVANYCYAEREGKDGKYRIAFNELDAMVTNVRRAALCQRHPLILVGWAKLGFGGLSGGSDSVMKIFEHGKKAGWPELLFAVSDEPAAEDLAARISGLVRHGYARPRTRGVRTTTAGGRAGAFTRPLAADGRILGDLFDVWIEAMYGNQWPEIHEKAAKRSAELWMYNCWVTGAGYLQERFYAGLWTWRTGAKGNGVWSYGWYVRINESGLPESKVAWEGRLAGVNDYRYLQTLESTIASGERTGKAAAVVQNAKDFLEQLRNRIPYTAYRNRPGAIPQNQWAELDAYNPVPEIQAEHYQRIREDCTKHIMSIRRECGL